MTRRMDDRRERAEVRSEAGGGAEAGEARRGGVGGQDRESREEEAAGGAVGEVVSEAVGSSGDVARSVEMARRAAVMDVVPTWANAGREGPIPDVAPPRATEERVEVMEEAVEARSGGNVQSEDGGMRTAVQIEQDDKCQ